ncbi:SLC18B1 [Bugula neritina]|uniref:SLC18B1 n=1 Tax=Bugula neritina TaxID=10212 RepID=A0A7J7J9E9_BUGNE|nr:SLC18B1 [Bugula neritina]
MVLLFSQFSALCTDTFLFPFFPQEAKSKGLNHFEIGTVYGSFELARFTTAPVLGYLLSWISPRITCITATITLAITCIALGLMTYAPNHLFLPLCITIRAIAGSATASLTVSAMTILLKHTSFQTSTVVSLLEMLQGGGYAVGPALGAALHQIGGYTCMFWTLGGVIGATFLAQLFVVPEIRNERKSQSLSSLHMLKLPGIIDYRNQ